MRRFVPLLLALAGCGGSGAAHVATPPSPTLADSSDAAVEPEARAGATPLPPLARWDTSLAKPALPRTGDSRDEVLYRVGTREITKADLGDFVVRYLPDKAGDALTQLVDQALVLAEAEREGVGVSDEAVRERAAAYLDERRREMRIQYGPDADLERILQERLGRDLDTYRADAARLARVALLMDRLVRLAQLREDGVLLRIVVFPTEERALAALARLETGADMTLLARAERLRPPATPPPLAREDVADEVLRRKLFAARPGDYIAPVPFTAPDGGRTFFQVLRVTRRWEGSAAPYAELRDRIEQDLARRGGGKVAPTGPREYLQWKRRALRRHPVEVLDHERGFVPWTGASAPEER